MNYSRYKINFLWNLVIVIGIQMRNALRCDRKRKKMKEGRRYPSVQKAKSYSHEWEYTYSIVVGDVSKQIFTWVKLVCAFRSRQLVLPPHPYGTIPHYRSTLIYTFTTSPFFRPIVGIVYDTIRLIISCLYATIDRTANCHATLRQQNSTGLHFDKASFTNVRFYPFQPFFRVSHKTGFTGSPQRICTIRRVLLVLRECSYD